MAPKIFEGLKILDMCWIGIGPVTIKYFADHGATVIHVETRTHLDVLRMGGPFKDRITDPDLCGFFANFNSSKYGITLNLNDPRAIEIAKQLVEWADIVAESYTPRAMKKWGLDYENLVKIKPDIIMFSSCQQGGTGPYREYPGFGGQGAAIAGVNHLTGWPDREPAMPYGAYTDFINPKMGALAICAALDYHRRTGKGTHIDHSQIEGGMQFLAPTFAEYSANGEYPNRAGNRSDEYAPHGVFPCVGDERWIAIASLNDDHWKSIANVLGHDEWTTDEKFSTFELRKANEDELEEQIGSVTVEWDAYKLMEALQKAEVPAGVVQKTSDLFDDPQLTHRKHFWFLEHAAIGVHSYDGPSFRMSKTPGELTMAAPILGQHNEYVYKEILGMSEDEYVELLVEDVFE